MRKMKLDVDQLIIDSFDTDASGIVRRGTVQAHSHICTPTIADPSCDGGATCDGSCGGSCGCTAGYTCGGSCADFTCNTCYTNCQQESCVAYCP